MLSILFVTYTATATIPQRLPSVRAPRLAHSSTSRSHGVPYSRDRQQRIGEVLSRFSLSLPGPVRTSSSRVTRDFLATVAAKKTPVANYNLRTLAHAAEACGGLLHLRLGEVTCLLSTAASEGALARQMARRARDDVGLSVQQLSVRMRPGCGGGDCRAAATFETGQGWPFLASLDEYADGLGLLVEIDFSPAQFQQPAAPSPHRMRAHQLARCFATQLRAAWPSTETELGTRLGRQRGRVWDLMNPDVNSDYSLKSLVRLAIAAGGQLVVQLGNARLPVGGDDDFANLLAVARGALAASGRSPAQLRKHIAFAGVLTKQTGVAPPPWPQLRTLAAFATALSLPLAVEFARNPEGLPLRKREARNMGRSARL
jgi:hypothetical protein